ncbi:9714_t:CDS:1 [Cetraspora pellucida]|uniref:9714_t:CDS:1 n=1 Tax=Cetraspora pellucida TaxID=1433469 RepID=A0A9N9ILH6_9GLOM|nr:9714_t:CDS:1 [Cetraspora pellucida]
MKIPIEFQEIIRTIQAIVELQTTVKEIGQYKYFLTQTVLKIDNIRLHIRFERITILDNLNSSIIEQEEHLKKIIETYKNIEEQQKNKLKLLLEELYLIIREELTFDSLTKELAKVLTKIKKTI